MFARFLIAIFGIAVALCQASYGSEQPTPQKFKYWGCAVVDAASFSNPVPLPNGVLTPDMCKAACASHMFAAVSPNACRCGNNPNAIKSIHEGFCNNPCSEGPNSPMCGGGCSEGDSDISNLFSVQPALIQDIQGQSAPSNNAFPVSSSVVSFASAALPWQTSRPPSAPSLTQSQAHVLPSTRVIVQRPPDVASSPPSTASDPVDPPITAPGRLLQSTSTSTVQVPSSLTWPGDEPSGAPVQDPVSLSSGSEVLSASEAVSPTGETLLTETSAVPVPAATTSQVFVSGVSQFDIPLLVTLGELLLIIVVLI